MAIVAEWTNRFTREPQQECCRSDSRSQERMVTNLWAIGSGPFCNRALRHPPTLVSRRAREIGIRMALQIQRTLGTLDGGSRGPLCWLGRQPRRHGAFDRGLPAVVSLRPRGIFD